MHYEVEHYTWCDGWINCWSIIIGNDEFPQTFTSEAEAVQELTEFFQDEADALIAGDIEGCSDAADYRIVKINDDGSKEIFPHSIENPAEAIAEFCVLFEYWEESK
jgi:hypothetical protein